MLYYQKHDALIQYKERLLERRIKEFSEKNWWEWGRRYYDSELPRLYVNNKTRIKNPFFLSKIKAYDGSILAIFPKFSCTQEELTQFCDALNQVDWGELGFIIDGRYVFTQRSLEQIVLPKHFEKYVQKS